MHEKRNKGEIFPEEIRESFCAENNWFHSFHFKFYAILTNHRKYYAHYTTMP